MVGHIMIGGYLVNVPTGGGGDLRPGERRELVTDLRQLPWRDERTGTVLTFDDAFPPGAPGTMFTYTGAPGEDVSETRPMAWFWVASPGTHAEDTLALSVTGDPYDDSRNEIVVSLRNAGFLPVSVPAELPRPSRLQLALGSPMPGEGVPPIEIALDKREPEPLDDPACRRFTPLEPGQSIRRRFQLTRLAASLLPPGPVCVRAVWINDDDGARFGWRAVTGQVDSGWLRLARISDTDGGLRVTTRVEPATPRSDEPFRLTARYENVGTKPLRVPNIPFAIATSDDAHESRVPWEIVPTYASPIPRIPWFEAAESETAPPAPATFLLAPGESRAIYVNVARVLVRPPRETGRASEVSRLPAGAYDVAFGLDSPAPSVGMVAGAHEEEPLLWHGALRAHLVRLTVLPPLPAPRPDRTDR